MNIAKILKKCPSGTKLYSPLYGEIELVSVYDKKYPIVCSHKVNNVEYYRTFTEEGKCRDYNAELMLYPSRDQRDWNKFGVTEQETISSSRSKWFLCETKMIEIGHVTFLAT